MKTRLPFQVQSRDDSQTDPGIETKTLEQESRNVSIFFFIYLFIYLFFEVLKFVTHYVLNDFKRNTELSCLFEKKKKQHKNEM